MTTKLRALVVDDEPMARATLRKLLEADPEVGVVRLCEHADEAQSVLAALEFDLLFLDVEMPGRSGITFLESIPKARRPVIVFTTAYERYALRAFDEEAADYLLKPFGDARFRQALHRAKVRLRQRAARPGAAVAEPTLESADTFVEQPGEAFSPRLAIHREGEIVLVEVASIAWIQAADQYVRLHTESGEHLMRASLGLLEQKLDPARFMRVHRSAIVALDRIARMESLGAGTGRLILRDGSDVPVSRSFVPTVRRRLG